MHLQSAARRPAAPAAAEAADWPPRSSTLDMLAGIIDIPKWEVVALRCGIATDMVWTTQLVAARCVVIGDGRRGMKR